MEISDFLETFSKAVNPDDNINISSYFNSLYTPPIVICQDDEFLYVSVDLPGIDRKSLLVDFCNNKIDINCNRTNSYTGQVIQSEIKFGNLKRKITLPISVTSTKNAFIKYVDGVLYLTIDKKQEEKNKFSLALDTNQT